MHVFKLGATVVALLVMASRAVAGIMIFGTPNVDTIAAGISEVRFGCSQPVSKCVEFLSKQDLHAISSVAVAFTAVRDGTSAISRAQEFATLAKTLPKLREIGSDDFFAFVTAISDPNPEQYLIRLIEASKSGGTALGYGVTIYETDLDRIETSNRLTAAVRAKIDRVAFYLLHRGSIDHYEAYLERVKRLFPNARVYAGIYAYDRRNYVSCAQGTTRLCRQSEELQLYEGMVRVGMSLLRAQRISGIELYPSLFGVEADWPGWNNPKICPAAQRQTCVDVTAQMTRIMEAALRAR